MIMMKIILPCLDNDDTDYNNVNKDTDDNDDHNEDNSTLTDRQSDFLGWVK